MSSRYEQHMQAAVYNAIANGAHHFTVIRHRVRLTESPRSSNIVNNALNELIDHGKIVKTTDRRGFPYYSTT